MDRRRFLGWSVLAAGVQALPRRASAQAGGRDLVIGQSIDLSGVMQNIGREYFTGAKLAFDEANLAGGVGGRSLRLVQLDDGGDPARAVANVRQLLEAEGAEVLFGLCSEACVEAVSRSEVFKRSGVDLFAPLSGTDHAAAAGRVVYLHPDQATEMRQILERLNRLSLTRLAIVHSQSPSMLAARDAALAAIKRQNAELPRSYALQDGATNAPAVLQAISRDGIQAVIVMADAFAAGLLVKSLRQSNPALFICVGSMVDLPTVLQIAGAAQASGMMAARAVPDPSSALLPVVTGFRRTLTRYMDEVPTAMSLEGYIAAQALLATLRRAGGSRRLAAVARDRVGVLDLGGFKLDLTRPRAIAQVQMAMLMRDGRLI